MPPFVKKAKIKRNSKQIDWRLNKRRKLMLNKRKSGAKSNRFDIIGNLPRELVHDIFSRLNPSELRNALRVCRKWKDLANDDYFWKHKCKMDNYVEVKETSRRKVYEEFVCNSTNYWERVYMYNEALHQNWLDYEFKESIFRIPRGFFVVHYFDDEILIITNHSDRIYVYNHSAYELLQVFPIRRSFHEHYIIKKSLNFVVYCHKNDKSFIVWCIDTGVSKLNMILSVENEIKDVVTDKNLVAILCKGGTCQIVNILSEEVEYRTNSADLIRCVCFHEGQVAFGTCNGIIYIMNWEDKAIVTTLIYNAEIDINRIMINGDYLISFSIIDICVWSLQTKAKLHAIVCGDRSNCHKYADFSNSTTLLAFNEVKNMLEAWNLIDGTRKFNIVLKGVVKQSPVIMNDHYIFTNGYSTNVLTNGPSKVKIWCKKTGELVSNVKFNCRITNPLVTNTKFTYLNLSYHPTMHMQDYEKKITLRQLNALDS